MKHRTMVGWASQSTDGRPDYERDLIRFSRVGLGIIAFCSLALVGLIVLVFWPLFT